MKAIFCSTMFSDPENDVKWSKKPNTISGHKFQESLIYGIKQNDCDISVINIQRVRHYPDYPKILFHKTQRCLDGGIACTDVGFINLFGLDYISQIIGMYRALRKNIKQNKKEQYVLVIFNTHLKNTFAALMIRAMYPNVLMCDIIGDLHRQYGMQSTIKGLKGSIVRVLENFQDKLARHYDCFGFVTKYMAEAIGAAQKPFIVLECTYSEKSKSAISMDSVDSAYNKEAYKQIFYAGAIRHEYGIEHLLRAFSMIEDRDFRLILAGDGNARQLVEEYAERDDRIQYLGFITPQEVELHQRKATVLISPRQSGMEFVKYSFPSKTMEGLASGKPYIAHKLPCDPPEYAEHIQYPEDESDEALKNKIEEICALPKEKRDEIGEAARQFILEQKNPKVMCRRIVDMWKEL